MPDSRFNTLDSRNLPKITTSCKLLLQSEFSKTVLPPHSPRWFHAEAQSTQRAQSKRRTFALAFIAPLAYFAPSRETQVVGVTLALPSTVHGEPSSIS